MQTDIIAQLAAAIADRVQPRVPLDIALWSADDVAVYLGMTTKTVSNHVVTLPGFPQAIRLPSRTGGRGHPRWKAGDVIAWAESYQDRRAA